MLFTSSVSHPSPSGNDLSSVFFHLWGEYLSIPLWNYNLSVSQLSTLDVSILFSKQRSSRLFSKLPLPHLSWLFINKPSALLNGNETPVQSVWKEEESQHLQLSRTAKSWQELPRPLQGLGFPQREVCIPKKPGIQTLCLKRHSWLWWLLSWVFYVFGEKYNIPSFNKEKQVYLKNIYTYA